MKQIFTLIFAIGISCLLSAQLINEFEPNPNGGDPAMVQFEIKGTPGASFTGFVVSIENDGIHGGINSSEAVSGTFDGNGLLVVMIADLENPSFTLVLSSATPTMDIDSDNDGTVDDLAVFGTIYDAIGIADSNSDAAVLYADQLGGTNFPYTGDEPMLVFRDPDNDAIIYAINDPAVVVHVSDGSTLPFTDFESDPTVTTFGMTNISLPVDLVSFEGKSNGKSTHLTWQTASEINNEKFEIERSKDGYSYEKIGTEKGVGNSHDFNDYEYEDTTPNAGANYYRLKQVDFDGRYEYSPTISVRMKDTKSTITPTKTYDFVNISVDTDNEATVGVYNVSGTLMLNATSFYNDTTLDIAELPKGIYFVRLMTDGNIRTEKIIKL